MKLKRSAAVNPMTVQLPTLFPHHRLPEYIPDVFRYPLRIDTPVCKRFEERYIQYIEKVLHAEDRSVEQLFPLSGADGDKKPFPGIGRFPERYLVDPVFFNPQGLEPLHQRLGVRALRRKRESERPASRPGRREICPSSPGSHPGSRTPRFFLHP